MTTYKISIECDEATANQLIAMDGRVLGDKFINIITVMNDETGEVE
jgi:hypothetical protein